MSSLNSRAQDATAGGDAMLRGVRVVVTRPAEQADVFARALSEHGAEVLVRPLIRVEPSNPGPLLEALNRIDEYDWVIFTSANAVGIFLNRLATAGLRPADLRGVRVAAVGPATRDALEVGAIPVDLLPDEHISEAIAMALSGQSELRGLQVLWPCARDARPDLLRELEGRGARVEATETYHTEPDHRAVAELRAELAAGVADVLTLTSPSAVRAFVGAGAPVLQDLRIAVIGPVTAEAARAAGLPVHIAAREHTTQGLITALRDYASAGGLGCGAAGRE